MVNRKSPPPTYRKRKIIPGETLKLVKTKLDQGQELFQLINTSSVLDYLTIEIDEFIDFIDYLRFIEHQWQLNHDFTYTIMLFDNTILGQISLYNVSFTHYRAEVGIWLGQPYHSKGYGLQALKILRNFAFNEFLMNRLQAHMFTHNPASQKLFERANFQKEGILRQFVKKKDEFIDVYSYSCLKSDIIQKEMENK